MGGLLCPLMKECKLARPLDPDAYPSLKIFFKQFQINSTEIVSEIQKIYRKKPSTGMNPCRRRVDGVFSHQISMT